MTLGNHERLTRRRDADGARVRAAPEGPAGITGTTRRLGRSENENDP